MLQYIVKFNWEGNVLCSAEVLKYCSNTKTAICNSNWNVKGRGTGKPTISWIGKEKMEGKRVEQTVAVTNE